jgi:hypothetical protein
VGSVRRVVWSLSVFCGHPNSIVLVASKLLHVPGTHAVSTANF